MMTNNEILDYIKKSFELKNQGFYKPAIEMLYKALTIDPDNLEILAQLAHLYQLLDNPERAIYYVEKVLDINPFHLDSMLLLEEIYLNQKKFKKAKEVSEKIYEIQPIPKNLAKKIKILNQLGNFAEIKEIENSLMDFNDEVLYEIAYGYYTYHDLPKALKLLESASSKNPGNNKVLFLLGKIYYEINDLEKSKNIFSKLEETDKSHQVMNYLGLFNLNEQNFLKAIEYFTKAYKLDSQNPEYSYNLASAYFLNGWLDEAIKYFGQAICLDPENIDYRFSLAYLYYQKKMYDKALCELDFIKTIEQNHNLSNVLLALITAQKGDLLGAKEQLENIIKYSNADDFAYSAIGQVYKELSQFDSAKKAIETALSLNPNSLDYLSELLNIELEQKHYEEAHKLIDKILEINKNYIFAYIALAKIKLKLNEFDKVYDAAQDIIELDPNCPEGYYYNAISLYTQGDKDFAIESLKKSISLNPDNAVLYAKMSEFYQDMGDFNSAYMWAQEANDIDDRNYKYKWLCGKLAAALHNNTDAIKYYSQSYRLAQFDQDLCKDYANYLISVGKIKQSNKILNK